MTALVKCMDADVTSSIFPECLDSFFMGVEGVHQHKRNISFVLVVQVLDMKLIQEKELQ